MCWALLNETRLRFVSLTIGAAAFLAIFYSSGRTLAIQGAFEVPVTISEDAQAVLLDMWPQCFIFPEPDDIVGWKVIQAFAEGLCEQANLKAVEQYQPAIDQLTLGGVPVLEILPRKRKASEKVVVFIHGGAYTLLSANSTLTAAVPIAIDTGLRVLSVDYTLAPHAKWDRVSDQVIDVFQGLVKGGHDLQDVAVVGDSAGGGLAASAVLKMRDKGMSMPGAVVLWYPWSDITESGDTYYTLRDHDPQVHYLGFLDHSADAYADREEQKHPYVSPVYGNYSGAFPPTLIQIGTRDIFLSNAVRHYRAIEDTGGNVEFDPYEGMWHGWLTDYPELPEAKLARRKMAKFLSKHLAD